MTVRVFGSYKKPYPISYKPNFSKNQYVQHLPGAYAQSHPVEDFAETFAVCNKGERYWQRKYKNKTAIEKLKYMNELILKYKAQKEFKKTRFSADLISENTMTLGQYYTRKKAKLHKYQGQGRILM